MAKLLLEFINIGKMFSFSDFSSQLTLICSNLASFLLFDQHKQVDQLSSGTHVVFIVMTFQPSH